MTRLMTGPPCDSPCDLPYDPPWSQNFLAVLSKILISIFIFDISKSVARSMSARSSAPAATIPCFSAQLTIELEWLIDDGMRAPASSRRLRLSCMRLWGLSRGAFRTASLSASRGVRPTHETALFVDIAQ